MVADDLPTGYFVVFGGAAVGADAPGAHESTVNIVQVTRTLVDLNLYKINPLYLISLGGLVTFSPDPARLQARLTSWQRAYASTKAGMDLAMVMGQEVRSDGGKASSELGAAWRDWTKTAGCSNVLPGATTSDYVLKKNGAVFVFLDLETSGVPNTAWLKEQVESAEKDARVKQVFVFGSRPLAPLQTPTSDPTVAPYVALPEVAEARTYLAGKKKVCAYFAGSPALYDTSPLDPKSLTRQVVVGNGGGPLDTAWKPSGGPGFGYAVVATFASGRAVLYPFVRPGLPDGQPSWVDRPVAPKAAQSRGQVALGAGVAIKD